MLSRKVLEKDLFQVSLLPSGSSLVVTQSLHGIPPVYVSMSKLSLFIKLPGILDSEPCLLQYNLILTVYICNDSVQNQVIP